MTYKDIREQILNILEESGDWLSLHDLGYWLHITEDKALKSLLNRFIREGWVETNAENEYRYIRRQK